MVSFQRDVWPWADVCFWKPIKQWQWRWIREEDQQWEACVSAEARPTCLRHFEGTEKEGGTEACEQQRPNWGSLRKQKWNWHRYLFTTCWGLSPHFLTSHPTLNPKGTQLKLTHKGTEVKVEVKECPQDPPVPTGSTNLCPHVHTASAPDLTCPERFSSQYKQSYSFSPCLRIRIPFPIFTFSRTPSSHHPRLRPTFSLSLPK